MTSEAMATCLKSICSTAPRSLSPHQEHHLHPDLPAKDCLYIFANFLSYWKAPDEDPSIVPASCLQQAKNLLDAVRSIRNGDKEQGITSTVNILHIKDRWPALDVEEDGFYAPRDQQQQQQQRIKHAPPPFEVLDDPVIKCELLPTQQFEPLPAAAVFEHISKHMSEPPKQIVYSWIGSRFTACVSESMRGNES